MENTFKVSALDKAIQEIYLFQDRSDTLWTSRIEAGIKSWANDMEQHAAHLQQERDAAKTKAGPYDESIMSKVDRLYSEKREKQIMDLCNQTIRLYKSYIRDLYQSHFDFMTKDVGSLLKYINTWRQYATNDQLQKVEEMLKRRKSSFSDTVLIKKGGAIVSEQEMKNRQRPHTFDDLETLLRKLREIGKTRSQFLQDAMNKTLAHLTKNGLEKAEDNMILDEQQDIANDYMNKAVHKLSTIYNNEYSLMDIIFDSQFMILYILKLINYGFIVLSLFLAEKLFSEMYMKAVYGNGQDPPDILAYVGIALGLNVAFVVFMLTVLALIMYIFSGASNNFVINKYLIKKFVMDFMACTIINVLFAIICGMIIQKKRYFRYKTEGLRGVRALREIIMSLSSIVIAVPFFAII